LTVKPPSLGPCPGHRTVYFLVLADQLVDDANRLCYSYRLTDSDGPGEFVLSLLDDDSVTWFVIRQGRQIYGPGPGTVGTQLDT